MPEDKKPPDGAGENDTPIVSLDDVRREKQQEEAPPDPAAANAATAAFMQPIMQAIAKELAGLAGADGQIKLGGEDEAAKAKTAAVVRGLGQGLGAALAEAFGKWAEKIKTGEAQGPIVVKPDDPEKKS
jgi:hypothetical protein